MPDLNVLLQERSALVDEIKAIGKQKPADDNDDEALIQAMEAKSGLLEALDGKIRTAKRFDEIMAKAAKPAFGTTTGGNDSDDHMVGGRPRGDGNGVVIHGGAQIRSQPQAWEEKGIAFARFVKCWVGGRQNFDQAQQLAKQLYADDGRIDFRAAMAQNVGTAGGFLVPEQFSRELVDYLRNMSVVRPNARIVPLKGTMTMPVVTGGSTASYIGENEDDLGQDLTIGQRRFVARKLRALVPVSNDLIRNSDPSADMIIRDDLAGGLAEAEDYAFIRGTGTGDNPKGFRYWALAAAVNNGSGTTAAAIELDLTQMLARLSAAKKNQMRSLRWFMTSRTFYKLYQLRYAISADPVTLVFPEIRQTPPMLLGHPVSVTDQIPTTLSPGTVTEIYLVDMVDAMIGDEHGIEIAVSDSAAYLDSSGTMRAAFARDQLVIRAIAKHDFVMRRDTSIQILTGSNVSY